MKVKCYVATMIFFLIGNVFISQAFAQGEYNFNPIEDKQYIVLDDEFKTEFTYSGSDKLVKEVQLGAKLSAYYDETNNIGQFADFRIRITINGKSIIWLLEDYEEPTSTPEPDIYDSSLQTVEDEIVISEGDTIYLNIEIVSRQGQGILYKDNEAENNFLKLILDDPPVTCDVNAAFTLNDNPAGQDEVVEVSIGEPVIIKNTSIGVDNETATWEWAYIKSPSGSTASTEGFTTLKEPLDPLIFYEADKTDTNEYYELQLIAKGKEGEEDCETKKTIKFEVKCGVEEAVISFSPSPPNNTISKGDSISFINSSTGSAVTDNNVVWEWSFTASPENIAFPEDPTQPFTFNTLGKYIIKLKATVSPDLCSTSSINIIYVIDTNLSHAIKGLQILAGFDNTLNSTDKKLSDLVKDGKITLEDVISILKKIAEQ
ncbi:hypothetical protein QUF70_03490 [Desulfobacterales bacterium HSG17]|nr:hypothetical protein [Desulfobacterales bacterium HSG17]